MSLQYCANDVCRTEFQWSDGIVQLGIIRVVCVNLCPYIRELSVILVCILTGQCCALAAQRACNTVYRSLAFFKINQHCPHWTLEGSQKTGLNVSSHYWLQGHSVTGRVHKYTHSHRTVPVGRTCLVHNDRFSLQKGCGHPRAGKEYSRKWFQGWQECFTFICTETEQWQPYLQIHQVCKHSCVYIRPAVRESKWCCTPAVARHCVRMLHCLPASVSDLCLTIQGCNVFYSPLIPHALPLSDIDTEEYSAPMFLHNL